MLNTSTMQMQSHRVMNIQPAEGEFFSVVTKGDANNIADDPQTLDGRGQVRKIIYIIPKLGYVTDFIILYSLNLLLLCVAIFLVVVNITILRRKSSQKSDLPVS